jgi:GNAT superfamily N-acetyltransferase
MIPIDILQLKGPAVMIRPVRLKAFAMEAKLVERLPEKSRHYRFMGAIEELSPSALGQSENIDRRHSLAFVASVEENGQEKEIGIGCYSPNATADICDVSVTVANEWQQKGVDALLVQQVLRHARDYGIKTFYCVDRNNSQIMRGLADELGMKGERNPENNDQIIYSLKIN